jgi:hypothetical protein
MGIEFVLDKGTTLALSWEMDGLTKGYRSTWAQPVELEHGRRGPGGGLVEHPPHPLAQRNVEPGADAVDDRLIDRLRGVLGNLPPLAEREARASRSLVVRSPRTMTSTRSQGLTGCLRS